MAVLGSTARRRGKDNRRLPVIDGAEGKNMGIGAHLLPDIPLAAVYVPPDYEPHALPVGELHVDPRYQRTLDRKRVLEIVKNYNPTLMKPIDVNMRQDGSLWICDGMHRREVVREMNGENALIDCHVYFGLSLAQEAALFNQQKARVDPSPIAAFRSGLVAQQEPYVSLARVVHEAGWHVAEGTARDIKAPGSLIAIWTRYQDKTVLVQVLDVYSRAFGFERPPNAAWITGLGTFVAWYQGEYNAAQLVKNLHHRGWEWVVGEITRMRTAAHMKEVDAVIHVLINAHNYRQPPEKRIPSYETAKARAEERRQAKVTEILVAGRKAFAETNRMKRAARVHGGY